MTGGSDIEINSAMHLDTYAFIEEIKNRPAIWNSNTTEYKNKDLKKEAWKELVNIFLKNKDTTEVQKKEFGRTLVKRWKSLRDCYTRELKKSRSKKSGSKKKTTYVYFDALSFLSKVSKGKKKNAKKNHGSLENVRDLSPAPSSSTSSERPVSPDASRMEYRNSLTKSKDDLNKASNTSSDTLLDDMSISSFYANNSRNDLDKSTSSSNADKSDSVSERNISQTLSFKLIADLGNSVSLLKMSLDDLNRNYFETVTDRSNKIIPDRNMHERSEQRFSHDKISHIFNRRQNSQNQEVHVENDSDKLFLLSMLDPLKKVPEYARLRLKRKLMEVIEVELEALHKPSSSRSNHEICLLKETET